MREKKSLALGLGAAFLVSGCAYRSAPVRLPVPMQAVAPDDATIDVDVRASAHDDEGTRRAAVDATDLMKKSLARQAVGGTPAKVAVQVRLGESHSFFSGVRDGYGILFGLLVSLSGVKFESRTLCVDVRFETNGRTFLGHGSATKGGSIYASADRRALAVALDRALADAGKRTNPE